MSRPHIIYLMADQLRFDVLDAYGDRQCPTPHLDDLCRRSTIFNRHFTPCPLCVPARSSIMTGLYPQQHGARINGWLKHEHAYGMVKTGTEVLPEHLSDAGYRNVHVGIQHVRMMPEFEMLCGNTEFIGPKSVGSHHRGLHRRGLMLPDMSVFRDPVVEHELGRPVVTAGTSARTALFPLREDLFYDSVLADQMVKVIEAHEGDKPLCLFGMFWLPHPPLWAPRAWAQLVPPETVDLPITVGRWFSGMPAMQLANVPGQLGAHCSPDQWRHAWAVYLGMAALLDHCVGKVLKALESKGMFDDAMIIFTSDHGEMLGSHCLFQKMCLYEEAVRVPLIVKTPGQKSIRYVNEMTDHLDLTAGMLDYGLADPLEGSPGISLKPLAEGQTNNQPRRYVFSSYDGNAGRGFAHRMVRSATHKLIHNIGDRAELYDLIEDPRETHNVAGREEFAQIEGELRSQLHQWMAQVGDDQPPPE